MRVLNGRSAVIIATCLVGALIAASSAFAAEDCTFTDKDGKFYDFRHLRGHQFLAGDSREQNEFTYYVSLCGEVNVEEDPQPAKMHSAVWQAKSNGEPIANCVSDSDKAHGRTASGCSCGMHSMNKFESSDNLLTVTFFHGDSCRHHGEVDRSTVINLTCNPTIEKGVPALAREDNCTYFMEWETSAACPTSPNSGLSTGAIFSIVFVVVAGTYLFGGITYKRVVSGQRGWEMIPNVDMWRTVGGNVADGARWVTGRSTQQVRYTGLSDRDDEEALMHGMDDDDEDERLMDI